eukprot:6348595-Ditylum_brightwellii.AAC.1
MMVKEVRAHQQLITEIEFEWLRQWCIQGQRHARLHPFWHRPIERLQESYKQLECFSLIAIQILKDSSMTVEKKTPGELRKGCVYELRGMNDCKILYLPLYLQKRNLLTVQY